MASKSKIREKLFSVYSENLSFYCSDLRDKFLCPVCQNIFSYEDLQPDKLAIALAHVTPKSIGGKLRTLVCSRCDNNEGHQNDIHLAREKDYFDTIKKKGTKELNDGFLEPEGRKGIKIKIDITGMHEPEPHMDFFNPPGMPLTVWKDYFRQLENTPCKYSLSLTIKRGPALNLRKRNLSLIYAAFLMMFYQFGYEYILSKNANFLRKALAGKVASYDFKNAIQFIKWGQMSDPFSLPTFAVTRISKDFCFMSTLIPFDEESGYFVHLPGFDPDGVESYDALLKGDEISKFDAKIIPRNILHNLLKDPVTKNMGETLYMKIKELLLDESA